MKRENEKREYCAYQDKENQAPLTLSWVLYLV